MQKKVDHAQRRPLVIILCDKASELTGAVEVLSSQVDEFRTLVEHKDAEEVIATTEPKLIILARETVSKSIESYKLLAEAGLLNYPHENILLCENKESGIAFKCCIKGIFSDYFVYKPMYENYRLKMILHKALKRTQSKTEVKKLRDEHFGKIDDELKCLIDEAANYHSKASVTLNDAREKLNNQKGINALQEQLLQDLQKEHLAPLIDSLESQLETVADELKKRLKEKRFSLAELSALLNEKDNSETTEVVQESKNKAPKDSLNHSSSSTEQQQIQPSNTQTKNVVKIMVVEDNEFYREMVSRILMSEGYQVVPVESGLDAIKILKKERFSMVLLDLFMPNLDGYNTTKNIRNIPNCKNLPVVAISANKNKDIIRKWASLGLTAYITKPSTKSSLLKAVDKALQKTI
ncbi:response regulator [Pseudoalteromonas sp. PA2MD11]|uniref:response regulator n=1 Tax=Pseudoalteromonas sp. PA2MD11 TaxID=2785057 RepID=UPI001ADF2F6E|nr:response regulator [Pseudoalteromonas sp. PA2MD11]